MNIETANRLLSYRKYHKLSQEELAEKIGVSRQAVSKWERAEASPDTDNLITLAKIYDVTLDELLNFTAEEANANKCDSHQDTTDAQDTNQEYDTTVSDDGGNSVSFRGGIHVNSDEGDSVDISFRDGIHVDTSSGDHVHVGKGYVNITDKDGNTREHRPPSWSSILLTLPYPIIITALFLIWGFSGEYGGWSYAWMSFLTIPIFYSVIDCFKYKDPSRFAFPVLVALVYCYMGLDMGLWHPTWIIFLFIPVYYFICEGIKKLFHKTPMVSSSDETPAEKNPNNT